MAHGRPAGSATVEVGILGPSSRFIFGAGLLEGPDFADQDHALTWNSRTRVAIAIDQHSTLAEVVNDAARQVGIRLPLGGQNGPQSVVDVIDGVGFWKPNDDADPQNFPGPFRSYHLGVADDGIVRWADAHHIRIAELIRAAEAGLLEGDPLRIYLRPMEPQGAEIVLAFWRDFWSYAEPVLLGVQHFVTVVGAVDLARRVQRRLRRGDTLRGMQSRLEARGFTPPQVLELLALKPWSPSALAAHLGSAEAEAEEVLEFAGYAPEAEDGAWIPGTDGDAQIAQRLTESMADAAARLNPYEGVTPAAAWMTEQTRELLATFLSTGQLISGPEWAKCWNPPLDMPGQDAHPSQPEEPIVNYEPLSKRFRVIAVRLSDGVDTAQLETELNKAGTEGFEIETVWKRQRLVDGERAHILILSRADWDVEVEVEPKAPDEGAGPADA